MATNPTQLGSEIATALGHPGDVTVQVIGFAKGILEELTQNGIATFGGTPGPHPISGMTGVSMASKVTGYAGYGIVSPELLNFCSGIVAHILLAGIVTYSGPPTPPGADWFLGGIISGLSGAGMAASVQAMVPYPFVSAPLLAMCTAVATHIMTNAQVVSGVIS